MPPVIHFAKSGAKHAPTLPADAVTRTFGIFGVKGSGKTTTARVLAEGIAKLGGHVVILDPVGVWWGITRDGEGKGVPGIVIGGEHGDVPLEETGGQLVAELVVARQYPAVVVDLKLLRKGAAQRFMADFLEAVYFSNRRPLHMIFEEADRALPQNPRGMDPTLGRVLGAAEDIVKLGRSRGLGSTFISQRIATVTKNVVEQVEALILHAQPGPRDRKAVKEWVEANGDVSATTTVMESMASLPMGEAWLYSPSWLRLLERVKVRMPKTLDSSSTPTDDEREAEESAPRAPVDLDDLRRMMAETVERAEANDPKKLRKRIEELERQLAEAPASEPERIIVPDREAVLKLTEGIAHLEAFVEDLDRAAGELRASSDSIADDIAQKSVGLAELLHSSTALLDRVGGLPTAGAPVEQPREMPERGGRSSVARSAGRGSPAPAAPRPAAAGAPELNGSLRRGERAMLAALAEYPEPLTPARWSMLASRNGTAKALPPSGSTWKTYERVLRRHALIEQVGGKTIITDAGLAALADPPAPLRSEQMRSVWEGLLRAGERDILGCLLGTTGWMSEERVGDQIGLPASGSTFKTYVRVLAKLELIERASGDLRAADFLR